MPSSQVESAPQGAPIRIALFNLKYSQNLGDGLIALCLQGELSRALPQATFEDLDLAGRTSIGASGRHRKATLTMLRVSPRVLRTAVVRAVLGWTLARRIRPRWEQALQQADAVIVGGGNLFNDADLNFPLKIEAACAEAALRDLPVAVYAVGMANNWSSRGHTLFHRAMSGSRLVYASVREAQSAAIWNNQFGRLPAPAVRVVHDPGLLIARHVPQRIVRGSGLPRIGIGLTHPNVLNYHADHLGVSDQDMTDWFVSLIRETLARGWEACLFTNGSREDDSYLHQVVARLSDDERRRVSVAPRFTRPEELAAYISGMNMLVAHRLHAAITAYSYGIPSVGLAWDEKLKSFFVGVGRTAFVRTAGVDTVASVLDLVRLGLAEGLPTKRHEAVLAEARQDVVHLARTLEQACSHAGASTAGRFARSALG